jgi:ribosomal-protein-serine acetyltransferase
MLDAIRESMAEVSKWMTWCHEGYGPAEAAAWISRSIAASLATPPSEHNFLVSDAGGRIVGTCGLNQIRQADRVANLGYWIRTSATKAGVATEAVGRIAEYAFRETSLARLEIVVALENAASRRVAEKSGAIFEGVARDRIFIHGEQIDAAMYVLLRPRIGEQP